MRAVADNVSILSAQAYSPYGEPLMPAIPSGFGFTGEQTDPSNALVYLRARHLNPRLGIFGSLDPLEGNHKYPSSLNRYSWVQGNVVNRMDATGMCAGHPYDVRYPNRDAECWEEALDLYLNYGVIIDTGGVDNAFSFEEVQGIHSGFHDIAFKLGGGTWRSGANSIWYENGYHDADIEMGRSIFLNYLLPEEGVYITGGYGSNGGGAVNPELPNTIRLGNSSSFPRNLGNTVVHEFGHVMSFHGNPPIWDFMSAVGSSCPNFDPTVHITRELYDSRLGYDVCSLDQYQYPTSGPRNKILGAFQYHPVGGPYEDFAESWTAYINTVDYVDVAKPSATPGDLREAQGLTLVREGNLRYMFMMNFISSLQDRLNTNQFNTSNLTCRKWVDIQAGLRNDSNPDYSICGD